MLFALNCRIKQFLHSLSANEDLIQPQKLNNMTNTIPSPKTLFINTGRITFQAAPNSPTHKNITRSSNKGQPTPNVEVSKEEVFENNLTQLLMKGFLAVFTTKDTVLKEVRYCILQNDEQRCKHVNHTCTLNGVT